MTVEISSNDMLKSIALWPSGGVFIRFQFIEIQSCENVERSISLLWRSDAKTRFLEIFFFLANVNILL